MSWEAAGAVGEILGALAVFLTLIYLAVQIRQNTNAVRASATDAAISHVNNVREALFSNEQLVKIYVQGSKDPESLDEEAAVRYRLLLHNILMAEANVQAQAALTGLSKDNWETQLPIVLRVISSPGGIFFWKNFKHEFEKNFREEVDEALSQRGT